MRRLLLAVCATLGSISCGKDGAAGLSTNSAPACCVYAAQYTTRTSTPGVADVSSATTCSLDQHAATFTCVQETTGAQCSSTSTLTTRYLNVDDFVAAHSMIGKSLAQSTTQQVNSFGLSYCASLSYSVETTITYDGQRRISGYTARPSLAGSPVQTATYSEWDTRGRGTKMSIVLQGLTSCSRSVDAVIVYDDAARTATSTSTSCGTSAGLITTYDANLNVIEMRSTAQASTISSMTIGQVATVCRSS